MNQSPGTGEIELIATTEQRHLIVMRRIYDCSFPIEEQRPWENLIERCNCGDILLLGIFLSGKPVGLVTLWNLERARYIEHFAIAAESRNHGIGQQVIALLKDNSVKPLLLEAEPPESSPEASRRIMFYRRNGFSITDKNYIQPPYKDGLPPVPLWLMSTSPSIEKDIASQLHQRVYGTRP